MDHLSEAALNRERVHVEVEWLIHLTSHHVVPGAPTLSSEERDHLRRVVTGFDEHTVAELAATERITVHDVKAVEYLLKERLVAAPSALGEDTVLPAVTELVHFACTSEDINNLAYALMVRGAVQRVWLPAARALTDQVAAMAREHAAVPMLARTHGQPATPTTLGKELAVLAHRLRRQVRRIEAAEYLGKINGATGTYGAHLAAVPRADWMHISQIFVEHLGLTWNPLTTQIESHDWQAELYADLARFNRVLHNLATDMWTYISLGYFAQVRGQGTVGSSTMPHKVNPIRFENAEANLEISCALLDTFGATLVTSRMQRDLTDSTTQRNIGPAFGHSLLAIDNVRRGPGRAGRRRRRDGAGPRRELGGARRGRPVGDARRRGGRGAGHGEPVRAAQGAHPRAADHRGRPARVRAGPRAAGPGGPAAGGDDAGELHRRRGGPGALPGLTAWTTDLDRRIRTDSCVRPDGGSAGGSSA